MMELGQQEAKVYFFDEAEFKVLDKLVGSIPFNNDYNLYKSALKENWDSYFVGRETNINVSDIVEKNDSVFYIIDDDILWLEVLPNFINGDLTWNSPRSRLFSVRGLKRKSELFTGLNLLTSKFSFIDSVWKIIDRNDKIKKIIDE